MTTVLAVILFVGAILAIVHACCRRSYDHGYQRGTADAYSDARDSVQAGLRDTDLVAFRRELFTIDALPTVDLEELN